MEENESFVKNDLEKKMDDELVKCVLKSDTIENREYVCTFTKLGKGAYSKVYKGYIRRTCSNDNSNTNQSTDIADGGREYVAIKKMNLEQLRAHDFLENEIGIMKRLNHKNTLNMLDVIEESNNNNEKVLYIILELCGGGDLKKMVRNRRMKEKYAIMYFKQIADGLQYLRSKNIIHRDLKPQNVLLTSDRKTLKIADFGFAKMIGSDALAETMCGSPLYMAPEILLKKPYTSKADLWSIGIMLYEVLCAAHPFKNIQSVLDLVHKVEKEEIRFPSTITISPLGIDLLKRLLKKDPHQRIGWTEFFNHKWFKMLKETDSHSLKDDLDEGSAPQSPSVSTTLTSTSNSPSLSGHTNARMISGDDSQSGSSIFSSMRMSYSASTSAPTSIQAPIPAQISNRPITSPLPIIDNYSCKSQKDFRSMAMSPPSFMNSPMHNSKSFTKLNIIDNYESEATSSNTSTCSAFKNPSKMQSMPSIPLESSESKKSSTGGFTDYLGTSLKMLKDSFHSQTLH